MRPRILCVDDEPELLDAVARNLRRRFDVVTARSGADGLELVTGTPPFAVVMSDYNMPEMNGAAFLAACHRLAPDTVTVLLTASTDRQVLTSIQSSGVYEVLIKPCSPDVMTAALALACAEHMRRRERTASGREP
jgi:DNA-binding NtrC family response regulator